MVSTYIDIKRNLSKAVVKNFDDTLPIRDILRNVWLDVFNYIADHTDYFIYTEQFSNSPYGSLVKREVVEHYFDPIINVLQRGIEQKIVKDVSFDILAAFMYYPILALSNSRLCEDFELNEENIETAFTLAWDAIKL